MVLPRTRKQAEAENSVCYFTGVACQNKHVDKRYTNTGICYECKRQRNRVNTQRYPEARRRRSKTDYLNHRKQRLAASLAWARNNPERSRKIKRRSHYKHIKERRRVARLYNRKKRLDPYFRLCKNMSKAIWTWLKGEKNFRHWEQLVTFSAEQLAQHMETQFTDGMTWNNYGTYWEVDHIKPISKCRTFREAWKLSNLRPLTCFENRRKGNRT